MAMPKNTHKPASKRTNATNAEVATNQTQKPHLHHIEFVRQQLAPPVQVLNRGLCANTKQAENAT